MKISWSSIWEAIKSGLGTAWEWIKEKVSKMDTRDWVTLVLILIILGLGITAGVYYNKYQTAESTCIMLNDSTEMYKNKYNEEYMAKNTYMLTAKQLKEYNDELYKEYKSLKDHPVVITKTRIVTRIDTVEIVTRDIKTDEEFYTWNWGAKDSTFYSISGRSALRRDCSKAVTKIDEISVPVDITLDVIDDGNQLAVITKTNNPYVEVQGMQSVVIDPKTSPTIKKAMNEKKWAFGPSLSVNATYGYDPVRKQGAFVFGGSVGFSVIYILARW